MRATVFAVLLLAAPAAAQMEDDEALPSEAGAEVAEPPPSSGSTGPATGSTGTSGSATGSTGTSGGSTGTSGSTGTASGATGSGTSQDADYATSAPPPATSGTMGRGQAGATPYRSSVDDEEEEDEGDPYDFLWIEAFGGWSWVDLRAISHDNFYPEFVRLRGDGPMAGGALGFRIEFFHAGLRAAVAHYGDSFDVGTVTAEATLAIPIPIFRPYIRVGFGLGWHGDSDFMAPENSQTTVFGFALSGAVGADIYLVHWFSIGAAATVDVLNMNRQSIDEPITSGPGPGDVVFEDSGDAVGLQVRGHVAITFHL